MTITVTEKKKSTSKKSTAKKASTGSKDMDRIAKTVENEDNVPEEGEEEVNEEDAASIYNFFNYQRAINSLIDYLNQTIDDIIAGFTHSDQQLFTHVNKKLILNAILESGFYEFCKYRLSKVLKNEGPLPEEKFLEIMRDIEGEIDLLGYLLVNTRLVHRTLTFDLYLSLLKGGLFEDIIGVHERIVEELISKKHKVNKESIKEIKIDSSNLYI